MKYAYIVILILLSCPNMSAQSLEQSEQLSEKIELDIIIPDQRMSLDQLLGYLTQIYGLKFSYSTSEIEVNQMIFFKNNSYKFLELMQEIALQAALEIRIQTDKILVKNQSGNKNQINSRDQTPVLYNLSGIVKDNQNNPIPFVNLQILYSQLGTSSDESGKFTLKGISGNTNQELYISAIGFVSKSITLSNSSKEYIEITLNSGFIELDPVEVTTGRYELTESLVPASALAKKQIDYSPNLINDVFRTINLIPSVSSTDFSVRPRIRGGNFSESAIYLDGFELLNPFHIEIAGGMQGLFNTEYIESIKVYPGSFSGKYTDKLSGVVDLRSTTFFDKSETSLSIDLLNAIASTKIKIGDNLYFSTSLRRGYWDYLVDLEALGVGLTFYDSWNKLVYRPSDKHLLEANFLFGNDKFDYVGTENTESQWLDSRYSKLYGWMNWKVSVNPNFFVRTTVGYQSQSKKAEFAFESSISDNNTDNADFDMFSINEYFEYEWNENQHLSFGWEYRLASNKTEFRELRYDIHASTSTNPVQEDIFVDVDLNEHLYGSYAEYTHVFGDRIIGKIGLRASGQSFSESINVAPRLNLSYKISPSIDAAIGYGWFYQPDQFFDIRSEIGQSQLSTENGKAIHYTANLTYNKRNTSIRLDIYMKDYEKLFDDFRFTPTERFESFKSFEKNYEAISGSSTGLELAFNHNYGNHTLNVAYAYTNNLFENANGIEAVRSGDVPHSFSFNNLFQFLNGWSISTSLVIRSGMPYSTLTSRDVIFSQNQTKRIIFYKEDIKNEQRLPNYSTFDVRFSKEWIGKKIKIESYLNFLNLFGFNNIRNLYYDTNSVRTEENIFFPSLVTPGIKVTF